MRAKGRTADRHSGGAAFVNTGIYRGSIARAFADRCVVTAIGIVSYRLSVA